MFYLLMGLVYLCCCTKTLKEYRQMQAWLNYRKPKPRIEAEIFKPNTVYEASVNGVINTKDYQRS